MGDAAEEGNTAVTHWTQVLSNVSLVEFVLLAALTALQWVRHRIRGAGWVALSFAILGGLSLTLKIDPGLVTNQNVAKVAHRPAPRDALLPVPLRRHVPHARA